MEELKIGSFNTVEISFEVGWDSNDTCIEVKIEDDAKRVKLKATRTEYSRGNLSRVFFKVIRGRKYKVIIIRRYKDGNGHFIEDDLDIPLVEKPNFPGCFVTSQI